MLCPRCNTLYDVLPYTWLPACPKCGRAPVPLRGRLHHNGLAASLVLVAIATLAIGYSQPFMTMEKLGDRTSFSLIGGIRELYEHGNVVLAGVLLVFSVLFPIAKLIALLLATSGTVRLPLKVRRILHKVADLTGKYSMLDVLVVAVIIVLVKFQALAHVEARAGTVWFCAAVLLSMLAGALCSPSRFQTMTAPTPSSPPRVATSYVWQLLLLAPALLLAGYGYWRTIDVPNGGTITSVRITSKGDLAGQTRDAYDSISLSTSDFFLIVQKRDGQSIKTQTFNDTPLGNGLTWAIEPVELLDLTRVEIWDYNTLMPNKQLDRVELAGEWSAAGQTFQVTLLGTHPLPPPWALPMAAVGATLAGVVVLKFVWDQAI